MCDEIKAILIQNGKPTPGNPIEIKRLLVNKEAEDYITNLQDKVNQYDLKGNFIKQWQSQTHIQRELGFRQNMISMCCNNKKPTAYGYKWKLVKELKKGNKDE